MKNKLHKLKFSDPIKSTRVDPIETLEDSSIKEAIKEIKHSLGPEEALRALAGVISDEFDQSINKVTQND